MFLRFTHVPEQPPNFFPDVADECSVGGMGHRLFFCSAGDGLLGYCWCLVVISGAARGDSTASSGDVGCYFSRETPCGGMAELCAEGVCHFKRDTKLSDLGAARGAVLPARCGSSDCPTALPTAAITNLAAFSQFSGCVAISHCVLNDG